MIYIIIVSFFICLFVELRALKINNAKIFSETSIIKIVVHCSFFCISIYALAFGLSAIKYFIIEKDYSFISYFLTFVIASIAYIFHYIKITIYKFIPMKDKLTFYL